MNEGIGISSVMMPTRRVLLNDHNLKSEKAARGGCLFR